MRKSYVKTLPYFFRITPFRYLLTTPHAHLYVCDYLLKRYLPSSLSCRILTLCLPITTVSTIHLHTVICL
nr:MAG TPA: hypothetical protein [Caudoviricetes sp.]